LRKALCPNKRGVIRLRTLTISQLNRYVKAVLEEDAKLSDLFLKGEISNFTNHYSSGHFYFSLKDDSSSVRAVMFKGHASSLRFLPENGMNVIARASVGLFERDGSFQVYVTDLVPEGEGAVAAAVRQRREKLEKLGVFDPALKKSIPPYPMRVGVITSETGAAIGDITQVLSRRWPAARLLFCPALVQGAEAPRSLISALRTLDGRCDVIIIGRGGGSSEDLWAFQDEGLAMAVFKAETPVISAVGHEMDITICDMAADLRAPTPSAAAELAVPSASRAAELLAARRAALSRCSGRLLSRYRERLSALGTAAALTDPMSIYAEKRKRLDFLSKALYTMQYQLREDNRRKLRERASLLDSMSPLKVLSRGYTAVFAGEKALRSSKELCPGSRVAIRFHDGEAAATINEIRTFEYAGKYDL
jgi:exodeoxyribonuclease VII large subunit